MGPVDQGRPAVNNLLTLKVRSTCAQACWTALAFAGVDVQAMAYSVLPLKALTSVTFAAVAVDVRRAGEAQARHAAHGDGVRSGN